MLLEGDHEALINGLKAGDSSAFEHVYHLYKHPLFYLSLRYLKDPDLAEDALQEVFINLWNHRHQLDENLSLRGFLFTNMKHHVLNVIRNEQNRIRMAALASTKQPIRSNQTAEQVAYRESKNFIDEGINTLSDRKRTIFNLSAQLTHGIIFIQSVKANL